jgi:hypothetical protein
LPAPAAATILRSDTAFMPSRANNRMASSSRRSRVAAADAASAGGRFSFGLVAGLGMGRRL